MQHLVRKHVGNCIAAIDELCDGSQTFAHRTHSQLRLEGIRLACVLILQDALGIIFHE